MSPGAREERKRAIGPVGAHNLHALAGATAVGGTWTVCDGTIHVAPPA